MLFIIYRNQGRCNWYHKIWLKMHVYILFNTFNISSVQSSNHFCLVYVDRWCIVLQFRLLHFVHRDDINCRYCLLSLYCIWLQSAPLLNHARFVAIKINGVSGWYCLICSIHAFFCNILKTRWINYWITSDNINTCVSGYDIVKMLN